MNKEDVRTDIFTTGKETMIRMVHYPTNIIVRAELKENQFRFKLIEAMMKDLEEKVENSDCV